MRSPVTSAVAVPSSRLTPRSHKRLRFDTASDNEDMTDAVTESPLVTCGLKKIPPENDFLNLMSAKQSSGLLSSMCSKTPCLQTATLDDPISKFAFCILQGCPHIKSKYIAIYYNFFVQIEYF